MKHADTGLLVKTSPVNQTDSLILQLQNLEVDSVVLSKELILLAGLSTSIGNSSRVLRLSLLEQELPESET